MANTTSRAVLRQNVSKLDGSYNAGSTDTNIANTGTLILDTKLEGIGYHHDDALNNYWVWLNTTANPTVERVIEDYAASTGQITARGANFATESASAAFEIHRFRPGDIHNAILHAINTEFPTVNQQVLITTLHTHPHQLQYPIPTTIHDVRQVQVADIMGPNFQENILYAEGFSPDFSAWDSATVPTGSGAATNITLSKYGGTTQTAPFAATFGDYLCKCVSASSAGTHYWTALATPANYGGIKLTYEEWIYSLAATEYKVTIVDNAGSTVSSFHGGTGWERVRVTHSVPDAPTSLTAGITAAGNSLAAHRGQAILTRAENYVESGWTTLSNWRVFGDNVVFTEQPPPNRILQLVGTLPLTTLTADTTTIEVGEPEVEIITHAALLKLYSDLWNLHSGLDVNPYSDSVMRWDAELRRARHRHGMGKPPVRIAAFW